MYKHHTVKPQRWRFLERRPLVHRSMASSTTSRTARGPVTQEASCNQPQDGVYALSRPCRSLARILQRYCAVSGANTTARRMRQSPQPQPLRNHCTRPVRSVLNPSGHSTGAARPFYRQPCSWVFAPRRLTCHPRAGPNAARRAAATRLLPSFPSLFHQSALTALKMTTTNHRLDRKPSVPMAK